MAEEASETDRPGSRDRAGIERGNAFDNPNGYSGQDYHIDRERAEGAKHPGGEVNPQATREDAPSGDGNTPPEAGQRAYFDPATGKVHGAGSGAGGGNPGEDFASDPLGGSGYPQKGHEAEPTGCADRWP